MKTQLIGTLALLSLTACGSDGTGAVSFTDAPLIPSPTPSVVASPSASPSSSADTVVTIQATSTPMPPIPSSSPSPSPSPQPYTYSGGVGSQASPYELSTSEDVVHIADHPSAYFSLERSIDMTGVAFTPIPVFSGVLYGDNFELDNLSITTTGAAPAAFVNTLSGTLVELYFREETVTSPSGHASGLAYQVSATGMISTCGVESSTMNAGIGGNGVNTGTGNPTYISLASGGYVHNVLEETVDFNGNEIMSTTIP